MWNVKFHHKTLFYSLFIQTKRNEQIEENNFCKNSLKSLVYMLRGETATHVHATVVPTKSDSDIIIFYNC